MKHGNVPRWHNMRVESIQAVPSVLRASRWGQGDRLPSVASQRTWGLASQKGKGL